MKRECPEKSEYLTVYADLHLHTTASDGELTPSEVVSRAHLRGLEAIAITDHDTLSGLPEAIVFGEENPVSVIAGIEISAAYEPGTMHILGYFPEYPGGMEERLSFIQEARRKRCPRIIKRLNDLGMPVTIDEVMAVSGKGQIGRPHIAKALVNKGIVKNFDQAFSRYLAKGKPAYVEKERMTVEESVALIREFGGLVVLAHPFTLELEAHRLRLLIKNLKLLGLNGIEILYPEHTRAQKKLYTTIAHDLGLLITGGTDYHGPGRNNIRIGDFGITKPAYENILENFNT